MGRPVESRPLGPGLQRERLAEQELARRPVEGVVEAVAVGPEHRLAGLAVHLDVGEDGNLDGVPVVDVVGGELEVPRHLAGVAVEGEHRVGVEVVAQPHLAAVVGAGVAGAPVDEVQLGVVRAGDPGRRPARPPRVAQPRAVVGVVGPGNGVGAPLALAALGVVGVEEAADAELAAGDARHHPVLHDERRRRLAVAAPVVGHLGVPDEVAAARVDGHEVGVEGAHVEGVAEDGDAAVVAPAADAQVVGQRVLVAPVRAPGRRVHRGQVARRLGDEHHPVDDERGRLGAVELADAVGPLQLEVGDVRPVDLVEAAEALAVEGAAVHQPVVRLVGGREQPLPGDGRELRHAGAGVRVLGSRERGGGKQDGGDQDGNPFHGFMLLCSGRFRGAGSPRSLPPRCRPLDSATACSRPSLRSRVSTSSMMDGTVLSPRPLFRPS